MPHRPSAWDSAPGAGDIAALHCLRTLRELIEAGPGRPGGDLNAAEIEEILWALRGLGVAARSTGFDAYGCACMHLAERIEDVHHDRRLPRGALRLLSLWVEYSASYLQHPAEAAPARTLIAQLNHPLWESPLSTDELEVLMRALLNPFD